MKVQGAPCAERGCWAGAPSAAFDNGVLYLSYRLRSPRERGFVTRVAASADGVNFHDVWQASKEDFGALSIERCALLREADEWRLYASVVDANDRSWRIVLLQAPRPDSFDPSGRRTVLSAGDARSAGVKDPIVVRRVGRWRMFASVALPLPGAAGLHDEGDAFATGRVRSATGFATSDDGILWQYQGVALAPAGQGWDAYETRLSCVLTDRLALYDGCASAEENYEERTGIAEFAGAGTWRRRTTRGPELVSPEGTASLRYVCSVEAFGRRFFYYEAARADGSHELRMSVAPGPR